MYLSRIQLAESIGRASQLGRLLTDNSYGIHRLLWDLFTDKTRFLYREESAKEQGCSDRSLPLYYVLLTELPLADNPLFRVESKAYSPALAVGDRLGFTLRANPTISRKVVGKQRSSRHDVVMNAQQQWLKEHCLERQLSGSGRKSELVQRLLHHKDFLGVEGEKQLKARLADTTDKASVVWLARRAEKNGFAVESVQTSGYRWRALPEKGRQAGFSTLDYDGVLAVTDVSAFMACLASGLGPSKAFGCGLLMIRRLP